MEGANLGVWEQNPLLPEAGGLGAKLPAAGGTGVWGRSPPALKNFELFCKTNNFRVILIKNNAFKMWHRNWQCNMIQLVVLMGYRGGG